ncbi:hypothetical protein [Holdemania massiliensis]|uniref:hypothetical protein n=1 Tax=Holdemania massiliensis TaxID=1468449 RepID=UPI001F06C72E|nr:hypothetical protein [Holdemania massiliensis]MCH1940125.1 hypothetical protein [Holdemania massiliensis]
MKAQDPVYFPYEDLIELPHPVSKIHPPMARMDRAAQFNPFAALTGYEEEIEEAARLTEEKIVLGEDEKRFLDKQLQYLLTQIQRQPLIEVLYFVKDEKKAGGVYMTKKGRLKKLDSYQKHIIFTDGTRIAFADLRQLDSDLLPISVDLDFLE